MFERKLFYGRGKALFLIKPETEGIIHVAIQNILKGGEFNNRTHRRKTILFDG